MKFRDARSTCKNLGYALTYDRDGDEYAARPMPGPRREARTYYTNDLDDAVGTVRFEVERAMARQLALEASA